MKFSIHLMGIIFILTFMFGIFYQVAYAYFTSLETIPNNTITVNSPTPTPSPTPSPTLTPTPTGTDCGSSIIISGNGAWSVNQAYIECMKKKTVNQTNNTTVNTNVDSSTNTGGNTTSGNTSSGSATITGDANNSTEVIVDPSSNSIK